MAGTDRRTSAYLKQDLLKNGADFSFFQVIRLLRRIESLITTEAGAPETVGPIKVRSNLSLGFPPADVEKINVTEDGESTRYEVVANFLGLYGSSSPLPTFYTEELMDEAAADESAVREFVDIVNNRLYQLFFESLQKYRPFYHIAENGRGQYMRRLFCLEGFGEQEQLDTIPDPVQLLRYIGLFSQRPRSSVGLKTLLHDALGFDIDIVSCLLRKARIPDDQLLKLGVSGGVLGSDCILGRELDDRMGKFRVKVGPMSVEDYRGFFPGSPSYNRLVLLTELYLQDPLEYEIEIYMYEQQVQTVCLGDPRWSQLGRDTWLYSGEDIGVTKNTFYPSGRRETGMVH